MASVSDSPTASSAAPELQITREEILQCALPSWYDRFKDITIKTVLIDLSQEFIDYLNSDGCFLPQDCSLPVLVTHDQDSCFSSESEQEDWGDEGGGDGESDEENEPVPSFPELTQQISSAIESLGGSVLPKLNWSSPRDATWISPGNSLRCSCPAEIFLLLKSSDFIAHDLTRIFDYCKEEDSNAIDKEQDVPVKMRYTLCLRKWLEIYPSSEFRCFVHQHQLIGICQRQHCAYYRHLADNREKIRGEIIAFFGKKIAKKFPSANYVFDIYRVNQNKFLLIDFNPYCPATDPLLFSWEELLTPNKSTDNLSSSLPSPPPPNHTPHHNDSSDHGRCCNGGAAIGGDLDFWQQLLPVFRIVDGESIQPSDLQSFRLPKDVVDLSSGEDIDKFVDLFKSQYALELERELEKDEGAESAG